MSAATSVRAAVPASPLANAATITARTLRRLTRVPTLIAFATVQPILFVLLFTYGFGGAVHPPGVERYIDYVLPGIFILSIGFGASQTGVAVAEDLANGMIDRFRSLPIAGSAVLIGRIAADAVRNLLVITLIIGVGSIIGFRFHAGPAAALAAVALAIGVGLAFSSINALLGLIIRDPESAGLAGIFPVVILVFTSSALVPTETMPSWVEAFANVNPITINVDALRALCLGGPTATAIAKAIAWNATILAITIPLASRHYQRATIV